MFNTDVVMKKASLIILLLIAVKSYSQSDTTKKNYLSADLFQMAANFEAGLYYEHSLSNEWSVVSSYGHRFHNFGVEWTYNSGFLSPPDPVYQSKNSDVIKLGFRRYHFGGKQRKNQYKYIQLSIAYKYSYTKAHWQEPTDIHDGEYNYFSAYENLFGISFSVGREKHFKNGSFIGFDFNPSLFYGERVEHVWVRTWTDGCWCYIDSLTGAPQYGYRKESGPGFVKEKNIFRPTITISLKFGFGW